MPCSSGAQLGLSRWHPEYHKRCFLTLQSVITYISSQAASLSASSARKIWYHHYIILGLGLFSRNLIHTECKMLSAFFSTVMPRFLVAQFFYCHTKCSLIDGYIQNRVVTAKDIHLPISSWFYELVPSTFYAQWTRLERIFHHFEYLLYRCLVSWWLWLYQMV